MHMIKRTALSCLSLALLSTAAHAAPTLYLGMNGGTMERVYADKCCLRSRRPTTSRW